MSAGLEQAALHKLLERQLRHHFGSLDAVPPGLQPLLESISASYAESDADRRLVERSLELTSQELLERNSVLRAREREQEILFDSVPALIFSKDRDNRILRCNATAAKALGRTVAELQGMSCHDLFPPDVAKALHDDDLEVIRTGAPKLGIIESHSGADGKPVWVRTDKVPFRDERGEVKGVIVLSVDITERRTQEELLAQSQEDLRRAYDQLQKIDHERRMFLNNAAHELGTPLTPIKLQIHLLRARSDALPAESHKAVDILDRNFDRLSQLVRDLLDSARLQAASLKLHLQALDLRDVVMQSVENYLAPAGAAGVTLRLGHPDSTPSLPVVADPSRLGQVFDNLLSNAVKFTPRGGTIRIDARADVAHAEVTVRDDGMGMRPQDLGRLFMPFSQVHDTMQRNSPGTGLGLYVSRGIMEALGGSISAHSDGIGTGSTFTVRMPLGAPEPPETGPAAA